MVRLVVIEEETQENLKSGFQFLYGAIGGVIVNPAKVGLLGFNSYMVRLVDFYRSVFAPIKCCFNSYMVRLVVLKVQLLYLLQFLFQFLYGAIGGQF